MHIHYFNPDHEIAMAMNKPRYEMPRVTREMRRDLGFIPAVWADDGDCVVVDDVDTACRLYDEVCLKVKPDVRFILLEDIKDVAGNDAIFCPWGWNASMRETLLQAGVPADKLPDDETVSRVRQLSNRRIAVELLEDINSKLHLAGSSQVCENIEDVKTFFSRWHHIVLKAPWSCSGRGVRFFSDADDRQCAAKSPTKADWQWVGNTLERQGFVIAEVMETKILDFAMEFQCCDGLLTDNGLSLFNTTGSAYTGNMLMSRKAICEALEEYVPKEALDSLNHKITNNELLRARLRGYNGPVGIDMMIVRDDSNKPQIHPCVEINLRQTMGMAAVTLSDRGERGSMRIAREGNHFKLKIEN